MPCYLLVERSFGEDDLSGVIESASSPELGHTAASSLRRGPASVQVLMMTPRMRLWCR
jgi:hypothetical protein